MPQEQVSLSICRPTGWNLECPDIATWLCRWGFEQIMRREINSLDLYQVKQSRIQLMRNKCVMHAKEVGSTHLLFLDPDIIPDYYVGQPGGITKRP